MFSPSFDFSVSSNLLFGHVRLSQLIFEHPLVVARRADVRYECLIIIGPEKNVYENIKIATTASSSRIREKEIITRPRRTIVSA